MVHIELLQSIILENQAFTSQVKLISRKINFEDNANYAITGPRRAGKTYLLYQIIQERYAARDLLKHVVYINFEDERLFEFDRTDFDRILRSYEELFDHQPVLFLDEVHRIGGWEKFARRMADKHCRIFVTGSNAAMLSSDIATTLGGRFFIHEQYAFSFHEYLKLVDLTLESHFWISPQSAEIRKAFAQYFLWGGFPESNKYQNKKEYLRTLHQKVFHGDIAQRFHIRNTEAMRLSVKKIAENIGNETSYRRLANLVSATGVTISPKSVIDYISYFADAYFILPLTNYKKKYVERESSRKYYFIDNGLLNLFQPAYPSMLLENLVFLDLKRRYSDQLFYVKDKYELDFFVSDARILVQSAHDMIHPETRAREVRACTYFAKQYDIHQATIVTTDLDEEINQEGLSIRVIPAWKWLLRDDEMGVG